MVKINFDNIADLADMLRKVIRNFQQVSSNGLTSGNPRRNAVDVLRNTAAQALQNRVDLDSVVRLVWRFDAAEKAHRLSADLAVNLQLLVDVHIAAVEGRRQQEFFDRSRRASLDDSMADKRVDDLVRCDAVVAVILPTVDAVRRRCPLQRGAVLTNLLAEAQHA